MGIAAKCLHGARVCIIPRPENNFKPYALHRRPLAVVAGILLLTKILALGAVALMPLPAELSIITSARIIELTNNKRAEAGLNRLTVNAALTDAARQKAQNMLDEDYFAHISPSGVTPWFWMNKVGYSYQVAGENLAIDFVEAERVVAAWMASPTHKDNIMHPDYIEAGVAALTGEFEGGTSTVVVHMFGLPQGAQAPTQTPVAKKPKAAEPTVAPAITEKMPAVPKVTPLNNGSIIKNELTLQLEGTPETTVSVLINNQVRAKYVLSAVGVGKLTVQLADIPDGEIVVKAMAENTEGGQSGFSTVQAFTKDTQGPKIDKEALMFIASPATDTPIALLQAPEESFASLSVMVGGEKKVYKPQEAVVVPLDEVVTFSLSDEVGNTQVIDSLVLAPAFYTERDPVYVTSTARFSGLSRRVNLVIMAIMLILLALAIVIRINIQHPRMIAHASLVVLLALIILFL
ncbi:MAG: CAP domain-containing protein [bacterium]